MRKPQEVFSSSLRISDAVWLLPRTPLNKSAHTPEHPLTTAGSHKDHPFGDVSIHTSRYTAFVVGVSGRRYAEGVCAYE